MDEIDSHSLMKIAIEKADVGEIGLKFPTSKMTKSILSYSINCNKTVQEVIQWKYNQFNDDKILSKLKQVFKIYSQKKATDNFVDFDDLLCGPEKCPLGTNAGSYYYDDDHLSILGAARLVPQLGKLLTK